jgi:hypothetical protein
MDRATARSQISEIMLRFQMGFLSAPHKSSERSDQQNCECIVNIPPQGLKKLRPAMRFLMPV